MNCCNTTDNDKKDHGGDDDKEKNDDDKDNTKGIQYICSTISQLSNALQQRLTNIPSVHLHHPTYTTDCSGDRIHRCHDPNWNDPSCCGIVTFSVDGISAPTIQKELLQCSNPIIVSVSPTSSTPLDSAIVGNPDLVRASVSYTNTMEDIEFFRDQLSRIIQKHGSIL